MMNLKSMRLYLLIAGIIFSNYQILAQDTVIIASNQWICYDSIPDTLTSQVFDTILLYQWQDSTSFGGWDNIDGAIDSIYLASEGLKDTTFFRLIVTTDEDTTLVSNTLQIAVFSEFDIGSIIGTVDSTICNGQDGGILTANPSGGSGKYDIVWHNSQGDSLGSGEQYNVGQLYDTTEFYYYAIDTVGWCVVDDTISEEYSINVYDMLTAEDITGVQTPICSGADGDTLIAHPTGGSGSNTIVWYKNNVQDGEGPEYTVGKLYDTTVFYYTATDWCDTVNSNIFTIEIIDNVTVSITIEASEETICSGDSVAFTSETENGGTSPTYGWKVNGISKGTNHPEFNTSELQNGDTVEAYLTSNANCVIDVNAFSDKIVISVNPLPNIDDSLWVKTIPNNIGRPLVLIVCCQDSTKEYTYTWYKNGLIIPDADGQYYYKEGGIEDGTYFARVENAYNCTSESKKYTYPDGNKGLFVNSADLFIVYPNPSNGQFEIGLNDVNIPLGVSSITANIYSITGKRIYSELLVNSISQIHLIDLRVGIYIIELRIEKGQRQIKKLIIQ